MMLDGRPLSIPVILGTSRKGRMSAHAARFVVEQIRKRAGVVTELIDVAQLALPVDGLHFLGRQHQLGQ